MVIPARLDSQRLPSKPLLKFHDLEMIEHVRRRSLMAIENKMVFVTSSDSSIIDLVKSHGGLVHFSQLSHDNGLSRVAEFSNSVDWTHLLVVQGDEILVLPEQIKNTIDFLNLNPQTDFVNVISPLTSPNELEEISIVKCTLKQNGSVLDIFRKSPLTCSQMQQLKVVHKITGLFAISSRAIQLYSQQNASRLETLESIEQLRMIEQDLEIKTLYTRYNYPSVNTTKDVDLVERILLTDRAQHEILKEII